MAKHPRRRSQRQKQGGAQRLPKRDSQLSSEYEIPIFISSTDYNLVDLRAELARHLEQLGCKPVLSSMEGFADASPELEPWESCLRVLDTCYIMVLVVDGRYGAKFD